MKMTLGAAALAVVAVAINAQALSITPTTGSTVPTITRWEGNDTSQSDIDAAIASILGTSTELYKQDVGAGSDIGTLAASYKTTFSNDPDDPADALIEYEGGNIVGPTAFLLVKDGKQVPAWYLFNLTALGWNGTADLALTGFWPDQGAISHVTLYGTEGGDVPGTPDGGTTLLLLGAVMAGFAALRRKLS